MRHRQPTKHYLTTFTASFLRNSATFWVKEVFSLPEIWPLDITGLSMLQKIEEKGRGVFYSLIGVWRDVHNSILETQRVLTLSQSNYTLCVHRCMYIKWETTICSWYNSPKIWQMTHFVTDDTSHVICQMWGSCVCRLNGEKFTISHLHI